MGSNPVWRISCNSKPCRWLLVSRAFLFLVGRPQVVALIVAVDRPTCRIQARAKEASDMEGMPNTVCWIGSSAAVKYS